jgi:tRNA G18 (ribose-2'-O)-methylase SpoU
LAQVRALGFSVIGLDPDPIGIPLAEFCADRPERVALVLGTEGPGISEQARAELDGRVRIPMSGGVDSLNVAAASAVAFWALATASSTSSARRSP